MSRSATAAIWSLVLVASLALAVGLFPSKARGLFARATGGCESPDAVGKVVGQPCAENCREQNPEDADEGKRCFEACVVTALAIRMQAKPECADYWINGEAEASAK